MPTPCDLQTLLPDYKPVRKLGAGAFGEVWHAHGPGGLDVALKFIPLGAHSSSLEFRSLQAMRSIRHPNLVSVFGAWHKDDWLILAMELCDRTLQDRLAEALERRLPGIPLEELLSYMRDAANGLDALNAKHVQHRDVKPANLLLSGSGVKVADFGLAKVLERAVASNTSGGTLGYMAPECYRGILTEQSDQYSLAATYYTLRVGRPLFAGNQAQVMYAHLESEPDLSSLPRAEQAPLARALSKEPERRWSDCTAFVDQLKALRPAVMNSGSPKRLPHGEHVLSGAPAPRMGRTFDASAEAIQKSHEVREQNAPLDPDRSRPPGDPVSLHLPSGDSITFAWCPPGQFLMGSGHEEAYAEEQPAHRVTLTRGFYVGIHPVTQSLWKAVMGTEPSHFKGLNRPVECVSWSQCNEFCRKLTTILDSRVTARLPTEAEWEYACRAGTKTEYHFGEVPNADRANYDGKYSWNGSPRGRSRKKTTDVGRFPANRWGLYDLHGNVWEWCEDWIGAYAAGEQVDPVRRTPETDECRVLRGGSWHYTPDFCRASSRDAHAPDYRSPDVGFRVCFDLALASQPQKQAAHSNDAPVSDPAVPPRRTTSQAWRVMPPSFQSPNP